MKKKTVFSLLIIILIILSYSGCASDKGGMVSEKAEVMQALDETVTKEKESNTANQDLIELRQCKYGGNAATTYQSVGAEADDSNDTPSSGIVIPASTPATTEQLSTSYEKEVVTIQLITEDEMGMIIRKLLNLGYLESTAVSEADFKEALKKFQADNGLAVSGVLDASALSLLKTEE